WRVLSRGELADGLELELVEAGLALRLIRVAELGAQALAEERGDRTQSCRVRNDRDEFHLWLARGALEVHLRVAEPLDALLRERASVNEEILGDLVRAGFHHHDRVARTRDDEVERALLHLLDRRIEGELSVHRADANASDRSLERSVRDREGGGRGVHREDVVVVLLVGGPRRNDDLHVVAEAVREQRADGAEIGRA